MPGLASARPPAPLVEILDLIDAFAPEALISVAAGGRKKPRNPMPVPMVDQPCKIGVQVHDRGPVSQPWIGLSHAYSSLFFVRSEEHTSELQSLMRISYAVFCLKKKKKIS